MQRIASQQKDPLAMRKSRRQRSLCRVTLLQTRVMTPPTANDGKDSTTDGEGTGNNNATAKAGNDEAGDDADGLLVKVPKPKPASKKTRTFPARKNTKA